MPSAPEGTAMDEAAHKLNALVQQIAALLEDVQEERRRLHRERHAVFQIVIESGHPPTLHRLADMFAEKSCGRIRKD